MLFFLEKFVIPKAFIILFKVLNKYFISSVLLYSSISLSKYVIAISGSLLNSSIVSLLKETILKVCIKMENCLERALKIYY